MSKSFDISGLDPEVLRRASLVRWILLDSDGVLTDGKLYLGDNEEDLRAFDVKDGLAIRLAQRAGISVGVISGRRCKALDSRARELDFAEIHQGVSNKVSVFEQILAQHELAAEAVCFIGDDLIDLGPIRRAGFTAAPADAVEDVRNAVHWVSARTGGNGVVRDVIELILKARGQWEDVLRRFNV